MSLSVVENPVYARSGTKLIDHIHFVHFEDDQHDAMCLLQLEELRSSIQEHIDISIRQTQRPIPVRDSPAMGRPFSWLLASCVMIVNLVAGVSTSNCVQENQNRTNWAGNVVYSADCLQEAASVKAIIALVRSDKKVTAVGMRHCFSSIADNSENQLSLISSMHKVVALDVAAKTVTVDAGITYTQLCPYLDAQGFALHNLASHTDMSVAGAISTATHGSGDHNGNLATAVNALEVVTAEGNIVKLSRGTGGEKNFEFQGAVVGLGALGIITRITLDIQKRYTMRQYVYLNMSFDTAMAHFDTVMASGYSVSLFTDWQNQRIKQVWIKVRDGYGPPFTGPATYFGATLATQNQHLDGVSPTIVTQQLGIPGPWYLRLPHVRPGTMPTSGNELQTEYFVPHKHAVAAIRAVERLRDQISPHLTLSEIRTIAADELWMSTAYRRGSVAIHFTWKNEGTAVQELMPVIERALAPFLPRPHWGKLFAVPPEELRARYEKVHEFRALAAKHDPKGKFRNAFLRTNIFD